MQIEIIDRETQFDEIRDDTTFAALMDAVTQQRDLLLKTLIELIRVYESEDHFRHGRGGRSPHEVAGRFARKRRRSNKERRSIDLLLNRLSTLYSRYEGTALRGFIVESLVVRALRGTYAGVHDTLEDNVRFRLVNGQPYTSSGTIDVIGFDRARQNGEVHDCKLQATGWKKSRPAEWVRELERELPRRGFRVGLVTITPRDTAKAVLALVGIGESCQIIPLESLWEATPLLPPARP